MSESGHTGHFGPMVRVHEIVTAEKIGIETTTYVRNIYKYYVAYKLMADQKAALEKIKKE